MDAADQPADWLAPGPRFLVFVATTFAAYTLYYLNARFLPGNPADPLGWWGWADQGQYLKSARAFASGTWREVEHFYPPLYPWLGSWFVRGSPGHPFFLVDYVGFALHVAALLGVGRALCGPRLAIAAIVGTLALFPDLTMQHWAEPWTTSATSGIASGIILVFWRVSRPGWALRDGTDWLCLAALSFGYGAIAALRPLDVVVYAPLVAAAFAHVVSSAFRSSPGDPLPRRVWAVLVVAAVAGLVVPTLLVAFNLQTSGTWMGSYVLRSRGVGYEVADAGRKFVSLFFDSAAVYGVPRETIAARFWPIVVTGPVLLGLLCWARMPVRLLALTVLLQFAVYLPYPDLTPSSLYHYANVHYFKWTWPWLILLTVAQVRWWIGNLPRRRGWTLGQVAAVAALAIVALLVGLASRDVVPAVVAQNGSQSITIDLPDRRSVDYVDFGGVPGSFETLFNSVQRLEVDGVTLRWLGDFKLIPVPGGTRLIFGHARAVRHLTLGFDPGVVLGPVPPAGRAVRVGVSLACKIRTCALPPFDPVSGRP